MALKAMLSSLDELDDATKALYAESKVGEKTVYVLDIEDIDAHPKVRGVITANTENKRKRDEYKAKVDELEARVSGLPDDFDPDEWDRLKADGGKPDEQLQALKDQHARALQTLKDRHQQELADRDGKISERDTYIDNSLVESGLKDALLDVGVNPDLLDGAMSVLRGQVKVEKTDDGKRKPFVETDLGPQSIADFVKEWSGTKGKPYLGKSAGRDPNGTNGMCNRTAHKGNFGGTRNERRTAIAAKFRLDRAGGE